MIVPGCFSLGGRSVTSWEDSRERFRGRPWATTDWRNDHPGVRWCLWLPLFGHHKQEQRVALLKLRTILAPPALGRGCQITSCQITSCQITRCQITGDCAGPRVLDEQELSEGSSRSKTDLSLLSHSSNAPERRTCLVHWCSRFPSDALGQTHTAKRTGGWLSDTFRA